MGWIDGIMSGVQANMKIESFKVQTVQTMDIPYETVANLIWQRTGKDEGYNKLTIIKELRDTYKIGLKEAKTIIETVSFREGYTDCPVNDEKNLSILMYGEHKEGVK